MKKNIERNQRGTKAQETKASGSKDKRSADSKQKLQEMDPLQKEIEKLAYQFYLERGCHHGGDKEDWIRAEGIIRRKKVAKK